jgi:hypothetical protein
MYSTGSQKIRLGLQERDCSEASLLAKNVANVLAERIAGISNKLHAKCLEMKTSARVETRS